MLYYVILFTISCVFMIFYFLKWGKQSDVYYTLFFSMIPIINLAYLLLACSTNLEEAILANKFTYIGGCFLQLILMLCFEDLCKFEFKKYVKFGLFMLQGAFYTSILTTDYHKMFYKSCALRFNGSVAYIVKEYGFLHTLVYIDIVCLCIASFVIVLYGYKKKTVSRKNSILLVLTNVLCIISFLVEKVIFTGYDSMPMVYAIAQLVMMTIMDRISLYKIDSTAVDYLVKSGETGYFSFDMKRKFLGCNDVAKRFFPELKQLSIDEKITPEDEVLAMILAWMVEIDETGSSQEHVIDREDKYYKISGGYIISGKKKKGFYFQITDFTEDQKYINLLNHYNEELEGEMKQKTKHIVQMHDRLILGMADMVENRDISTGGHIKRTSQVVKILVKKMREDEALGLTNTFCHNVIKAAPMHDLGKITVEDAVLRKPGKFNEDEFAKMKLHAEKGGSIVRKILDGTDDREFAKIAENVAHYHHERYDGSGYPEHLVGDAIPLEARIMAIADVYDALVSQRCYKESFSFDKAFEIIEESMGTQFDPKLNDYFVASREELEDYYFSLR